MSAILNFSGMDNTTGMESIQERLDNLMMCAEGTLPGSRDFGLPDEFISTPSPAAINLFAIELQEKADKYVPEVIIKSVKGEYDTDGHLAISVEVEGRQ
ncbi:MAG: hypothetical protein IJ899_04170 [Blautia sp.]|nr:hypothetical protein [Blautia sp.]